MKLALFAADSVGLEVTQLLAAKHAAVSCVVVHVDDPGGKNGAILRGAERLGVTRVLNSGELDAGSTLNELRDLDIDLGLLAWWPRILRAEVIHVTRLGFLNLHPSLLPHNQGKDPNFWAIVEGCPFGVTIHFVGEVVDSGEIVSQAPIEVSWEDTGQTLYARAQKRIVSLLAENLDRIVAGDLPRTSQDRKKGSYHRRAELDPASRIDLDRSYTARELLNILRARTFAGHPAARFADGDFEYEVRVEIGRLKDESGVP